MKITAIIPTYNRPEATLRSIESVLQQSAPVDEIIVVNDASTDDTTSTLENFKKNQNLEKLKLIKLSENQGVSGARNAGIKAASHEWLAFLDSDDEWRKDKIKIQIDSLKKAGLLISHTDETWFRAGKVVNKKKHHKKYGGSVYSQSVDMCFIGPSTSVVHKSVFEDVGLFDTDLKVCEDYDLWLRITAKYPVDFIDQELIVKHGGHEDQLSTAFHSMDYYRLIALKKQFKNSSLNADQINKTIQVFEEKKRNLVFGCEKHGNLELLKKVNSI
jgi:glycosyltransferase involved in cell wall biosynthesis